MDIDENTMKRLLFVRILFENAIELSKKHEPYNLSTILSLHDSIEFLLKIFADIKCIDTNNISFLSHWKKFEEIGIEIPELSSMTRLNEARKSIKHYANLPSTENIQEFIEKTKIVIDFILTQLGLTYEGISLASLIKNKFLKDKINEISNFISSYSYLDAIKKISIYYFHYIYEAIKDLIPNVTRNLPDQYELFLQFDRDDVIEFKNKILKINRFGFGDSNTYSFIWPENLNQPIGQCKNDEELATKEKADFGLNYIIKYTILLEKKYASVREFNFNNFQ